MLYPPVLIPTLAYAALLAAAIAWGVSVGTCKLVKDGKLSVEEKLQKLEEWKASGKISAEEYEKARAKVLEDFINQ